jgi:hypothetical protein
MHELSDWTSVDRGGGKGGSSQGSDSGESPEHITVRKRQSSEQKVGRIMSANIAHRDLGVGV